MIRIAIAEDDPSCCRVLEEHIARFREERGMEIESVVFSDGLELVDGYRPVWDVLLLDIEMPRMDGMTAAHRIRALDRDVVIIFITNMAKYAIKGYEVEALDFVLKPVGYFAFSTKLDKALLQVRSRPRKVLMVPQDDGVLRLSMGDIHYIEVIKHRLHLHTAEGVLTMPGSLSEMEQQLAGEHFVRCNKGYLVNLRYVTLIKGDTVQVAGDTLLISRRRKEEFLLAVTDYYGGGSL